VTSGGRGSPGRRGTGAPRGRRSQRAPSRPPPSAQPNIQRQAPAPRPAARWRVVAISTAAAALALALTFGGFVLAPGPGRGALVELDWPRAASAGEATRRIETAGLVRSGLLLRLYLGVAGGADSIAPGVHLVQDDMSPRTLLRRLRRLAGGASARVVVPEGFNKLDVARRLHDEGVCASRAFLAAAVDPDLLAELRLGARDAEGYLFPATYELGRNADPRDVVRRMVLEAGRRHARLLERHAASFAELKTSLGWSRHEVVTLASIVEKETAADDERPLVASVFLNRLRDGAVRPEKRFLQSDPTARYGCLLDPKALSSCESPAGKPTAAMVHDPANRYSTYAHPGLTPGPIASPGDKALEAVLAPAQTRYRYFVAKGGGRHAFSETLEEHNAAVRKGR
jgi:UPF0755 protein